MKIVLVRPPFYSLFGLNVPKMKTYPLNLLYLSTYLHDKSVHTAEIVDGDSFLPVDSGVQADPEEIMNRNIPQMTAISENPRHELWAQFEQAILERSPDIVGISCNSGNMDSARIMTGRLKRKGARVILGGSHPTALPEQSLVYTGADFALSGESELSLVTLLDSLARGSSWTAIPSLAWGSNDIIRVNPRGGLMPDIDTLPIPDRSLLDKSQYFGDVILTGRGCPHDCAYCASKTIWGKRVRLRGVQSIIDELKILEAQAQADQAGRPGSRVVKIVDDTFTVNKSRTKLLLEAIIAENLNGFEYTAGVRADTLDAELVDLMGRANIKRVTLGVESGSPKILKAIRKGETNEEVIRAVGLLREAGIRSHAFFMIGFPDETSEDIDLSKELINSARPDYVEVNMVTPYPGTDLFTRLIDQDVFGIDRWYRWFHQGLAIHSAKLGYDLDKAYKEFAEFAKEHNERMK
jgi:anaerobic magnesium-protoporphyrin IX monomethyl ester cyclase